MPREGGSPTHLIFPPAPPFCRQWVLAVRAMREMWPTFVVASGKVAKFQPFPSSRHPHFLLVVLNFQRCLLNKNYPENSFTLNLVQITLPAALPLGAFYFKN